METLQYISLGSDCSIAYQLQKYNLRQVAYPFDWIRTNNLDNIILLLESNFQFFLDKSYLEFNECSNKFPILDDNWNDEYSENIILKHKLYNITFPHEIKKDNQNLDEFIEKYERRILRFNKVIEDSSIKKIFLRISNKNNKVQEEKLFNLLKIKATNFEIKFIEINKKDKFESWKKDEINWIQFF